jgi:hypothetical protein
MFDGELTFFLEYLRMIPMPCSGPDGAYVVSAVMQLIQSEAGGVNPQNHQKWVVETIAKCWVYGVAFPTVKIHCLLRVIPALIHYSDTVSDIYHLEVIVSGIYSDIFSGILSGIHSGILPGI